MTTRIKSLNRLLPLVAIGTIADCQSILEPTNRIITKIGLQILNQNNHRLAGIVELNKQLGIDQKMQTGYRISSKDLGFLYSPILNSSGRLNHASLSISVLVGHIGIDLQNNTSQDDFKLSEQVSKLIKTNQSRKEYVKEITAQLESIASQQIADGNQVLWLEGDWSKGVVGLLASRLVNLFDVPVVVVSKSENEYSASLRSPDGFDFPKAFEQVRKYLTKGGGHPQAAGFSATESQIVNLRLHLPKAILETKALDNDNNQINNTTKIEGLKLPDSLGNLTSKIDSLFINPEQLNSQLLAEIFSLEPFSQDFPSPKIITQLPLDDYKLFGSENQHLKVFYNQLTITCFNLDKSVGLKKGGLIWCKLEVSQNSWNGKTSLELIGEIV
jgi:single-stranded-DNA-specific exonuclease